MDSLSFNSQAIQFLDQIFERLDKNKIQLEAHWSIDHLCYRVSSQEDYQKYQAIFSQFAELLIESPVNDRMISTYKLFQPIQYKHWLIDVVELPSPKKNKITKDGFEHIEIVVDKTFDHIKEKYKYCQFDESGLSKSFNQELEIPLGDIAIKFHHLSLESVIQIEKNSIGKN